MRTESVDSMVADILEKVTLAKQRLDEATAAADALPASEGKEVRELLEPPQRHLETSVARLQQWLQAPPA